MYFIYEIINEYLFICIVQPGATATVYISNFQQQKMELEWDSNDSETTPEWVAL